MIIKLHHPAPPRPRPLNLDIDIDFIDLDPIREGEDAEIADLAETVAAVGILAPLTVVQEGGRYRCVSGGRRLQAARAAGEKTVPCLVVQDLDESAIARVRLIDNLHRKDLSAIETARLLQVLVDSGESQAEIAKLIGKSEQKVCEALRVLEAFGDKANSVDGIPMGHLAEVSRLPEEEQAAMVERIAAEKMTQKEVRDATKGKKKKPKKGKGRKANSVDGIPKDQPASRNYLREYKTPKGGHVVVSFDRGYATLEDIEHALESARVQAGIEHQKQQRREEAA